MNQPQQYSDATDDEYRNCIQNILTKYINMIRWNEDGANVLDVGCGPGDITIDILLPLLPPNHKQLIGIDRSVEMIDYAAKKYVKERVNFATLHLETENLPMELQGKFDHIFSFFCLHWLVNGRQGFSNLNRMLKTGGDMLLIFLVEDGLRNTQQILSQTEKWRTHMKDCDEYSRSFLNVDDPEKKLREILESTGFVIKVCAILDWNICFRDKNEMKTKLGSIDSFVKNMSQNLQDEYMEDIVNTIFELENFKDTTGELNLTCELFVVVGEKKDLL